MNWILVNGGRPEMLGIIPTFVDDQDNRSAAQQIAANYAHGGGWVPFYGFELTCRDDEGAFLPVRQWRLQYPEDPAYAPLAFTRLLDETVVVFNYGWTLVMQADDTWEVARLD